MRVTNWPEASGPMNAAAVKHKYNDSTTFRVAEHRYPAGTSFAGRTRAATWFVLEGACNVMSGVVEVVVSAGQVLEIEAGDYSLTVVGDRELHLVQVWDLRPFMN
jgi:mannose-6-phosphate isomerase-like protein (cupin superfamily)